MNHNWTVASTRVLASAVMIAAPGLCMGAMNTTVTATWASPGNMTGSCSARGACLESFVVITGRKWTVVMIVFPAHTRTCTARQSAKRVRLRRPHQWEALQSCNVPARRAFPDPTERRVRRAVLALSTQILEPKHAIPARQAPPAKRVAFSSRTVNVRPATPGPTAGRARARRRRPLAVWPTPTFTMQTPVLEPKRQSEWTSKRTKHYKSVKQSVTVCLIA